MDVLNPNLLWSSVKSNNLLFGSVECNLGYDGLMNFMNQISQVVKTVLHESISVIFVRVFQHDLEITTKALLNECLQSLGVCATDRLVVATLEANYSR